MFKPTRKIVEQACDKRRGCGDCPVQEHLQLDTRAKTTAKDDVADAKRPRTEQEAQNSSSSLVEPMAISYLSL